MINIYGTGDWATKITSLLDVSEYAQYDETDYDQAGVGDWLIALQHGNDRNTVQEGNLSGSTFYELFKGCNNLNGVTTGVGLSVGCCTLIRPGTTIGDQVYIGANCTIDINCVIGKGVTIEDNVTVEAGVTIPEYAYVYSGSVVQN